MDYKYSSNESDYSGNISTRSSGKDCEFDDFDVNDYEDDEISEENKEEDEEIGQDEENDNEAIKKTVCLQMYTIVNDACGGGDESTNDSYNLSLVDVLQESSGIELLHKEFCFVGSTPLRRSDRSKKQLSQDSSGSKKLVEVSSSSDIKSKKEKITSSQKQDSRDVSEDNKIDHTLNLL
ncbi:hypothetical protein L1887_22507 [Cichorium endivia]|nr:hypothetical protein L1887_22507 [Cichorium endivia]